MVTPVVAIRYGGTLVTGEDRYGTRGADNSTGQVIASIFRHHLVRLTFLQLDGECTAARTVTCCARMRRDLYRTVIRSYENELLRVIIPLVEEGGLVGLNDVVAGEGGKR